MKSLTYAYQLTLRQLVHSNKYHELKPITIININSCDIYGLGEFVYKTVLMEEKYHTLYTHLIEIYDVCLSYY